MTGKKRRDMLRDIKDISSDKSKTSCKDFPSGSNSQQFPETRYDLRVLLALRKIIRAVEMYSRQLQKQYKITGPQLITLLTIKEHEPITASAIAGHIHLSASTVIGILDRLQAKSLIRRDRDKKDRRLVYISLTEQGGALAANAPSPLQDVLAESMKNLPETELITIAESIERIVVLMQMRDDIEAAPILETGSVVPANED